MKTAISLPDAVFRDAERLAKRLRKSRSQLYREAVLEYVARHDPEAVTAALDAVASELDTRPEPLVARAASAVMERSEW
jgi:predicted transcriptional regulator